MPLPPDRLPELLRELDTTSLAVLLQRVVDLSVTQIIGAEHASISAFSPDSVATLFSTSSIAFRADRCQQSIGEGPCLMAAQEFEPVVQANDLIAEQRWPIFAAAAVDLGVRALLSFQLYTSNNATAALNIYASAVYAFGQESVRIGALLAAHAAETVAETIEGSNVRLVQDPRDTIGHAQGILIERYKMTAQRAFDLLVAVSHRTGLDLNDLAVNLIETGQLETSLGASTTVSPIRLAGRRRAG